MSIAPPEPPPPRLARGMYKRFALGALLLVLCSAGAVATAVLLEVKDDLSIFKHEQKPIVGISNVLDDVPISGPQTILILGSDRRYVDIAEHNPTRSDTIILLRLDPSKGATAIMSLPRDLKVPIPGHGTDKINAAYAYGGPRLSVKTIRDLLRIPINHVVNVDFGGFRRAVDRLKCVYSDIDRRYFNDNHPPYGGGGDYATIDIKAGYQKLCGEKALEFVRYRHFDSDLVRGARQQEFLSDAKDQIGLGKLFGDRKALLKIFGRYTQTDISSDAAIFKLLKLALTSAQKPIREIRFPGDITGDYVTVTPAHLAAVRTQFMHPPPSKRPRSTPKPRKTTATGTKHHTAKSVPLPPGMSLARSAGEDEAVRLATKVPFPVFYPKAIIAGGEYLPEHGRAYDIFDRSHRRFRAYRMVIKTPLLGQYYGVQGTSWDAPPILDDPSERRRMAGRTYELFFDGDRLRLVAWHSAGNAYWVSNTLLHSVGNRQMLALARSVSKVV